LQLLPGSFVDEDLKQVHTLAEIEEWAEGILSTEAL
jgi:hypothetical protein